MSKLASPRDSSKVWGAVWIGLIAIAFIVAATFRFLAFSGIPNDHFLHLAGAQQILFGEWPTRDFSDAGTPLMYAASALAQVVFGRTMYSEAILVAASFGLGAALTVAAVRSLTGSFLLALVAVTLEIAVFPRTYGYPKVLLYAAGFVLFGRYVSKPNTWRLMAMADCAAVAFLVRHDHGLYLWVGGTLTAALASPAAEWRPRLRGALLYSATVALMLLPYVVYVQLNEGLWLYVRTGVEFSRTEWARQGSVWPNPWTWRSSSEAMLVYVFHSIPAAALIMLAATRRLDDIQTSVARVVPLVAVAILVNASFIRDPLNTRLADAIVPAVTLGAWLAHRVWAAAQPTRRMPLIPVLAVLIVLVSSWIVVVGKTAEEINRAGLDRGWRQFPRLFGERTTELRLRFDGDYVLKPFMFYVDRCTSSQHHVFVVGFMPEVAVLAKRPFAGGLSTVVPGYYASPEKQQQVVDRMRHQVVPFVLIPSNYAQGFEEIFTTVADYLRPRFMPLTEVRVNDYLTIHILVNRELTPVSRDSENGWPCFR